MSSITEWRWQKKEPVNLNIDQLKFFHHKNREEHDWDKNEQSFITCETIPKCRAFTPVKPQKGKNVIDAERIFEEICVILFQMPT